MTSVHLHMDYLDKNGGIGIPQCDNGFIPNIGETITTFTTDGEVKSKMYRVKQISYSYDLKRFLMFAEIFCVEVNK